MNRSRIAVILLAVLALIVAGCGSSDGRLSKSEYIDKMNTLQEEAASAITTSTTAAASKKEADKVIKQLDDAIADIKELKPPKEWQKHHDAIVASLKQVRNATDTVINAKPGDVKAATKQLTEITAAQAKYESAINAINADR